MVTQNPSGLRFVEFEQFLLGSGRGVRPASYLKESSPGFQRYSSLPGGPTAAAAAPPEAPPMPPAPVKTAANGKAKETHKHQISQATPRNKRDNGELSRPEAAPASSRSTQGGTQEGTQEGTRKSVRVQAKDASLE
jgi:hypothetical protein